MLRRSASTATRSGVQRPKRGEQLVSAGTRDVTALDRKVVQAARHGAEIDDARVLECRDIDAATLHGNGGGRLVAVVHRNRHLWVRTRDDVGGNEMTNPLGSGRPC